jgi:hypothetical protein
MEGTPAVSAFDPSFVTSHPVRIGESSLSGESSYNGQAESPLDADGEVEVMERLKALGYLE